MNGWMAGALLASSERILRRTWAVLMVFRRNFTLVSPSHELRARCRQVWPKRVAMPKLFVPHSYVDEQLQPLRKEP